MPKSVEPQLIWDNKYGELLNYVVIDKYSPSRPVFIAKVRKGEIDYIALHHCYIRGSELCIGKGLRLSMEGGCADEVIMAMQALLFDKEILENSGA